MRLGQPDSATRSDPASADIKETVEDSIRQRGIRASTEQVHELVLRPLWKLGIYTLNQLSTQSNPAHALISWQQVKSRYPQADTSTQRALSLLQAIVCSPTNPQDFAVFQQAVLLYDAAAPYLNMSSRRIASAHACSERTAVQQSPLWRFHPCPPQSKSRARGVSERMASLLRVKSVSSYQHQPSHQDAPLSMPNSSLYCVAWSTSWLISAQHRHFLTVKAGMRVHEQLSASIG